ncbi:hypothetical protein PybrP1_007085 [[Pythium] brassicae (nom. inval.)]|nr:hypothetical protein PybrP1_007085 [[Pythium] brassicae (nom. inval.)]
MATASDDDDAHVDALLRQLAVTKHRELRLRAEKERVRLEMEHLRAGALWTREAEKRRELAAVRQAREQLQTQERSEVERLSQLDAALRQQELRFWKSGSDKQSSALQQAAISVIKGNQSPALETEKVLASVNCAEQQLKIEKLQAQLKKAADQEHDIKKLEQQLEAHRAAEQLKAEELEFWRLQDRIAELQSAVSGLTEPKTPQRPRADASRDPLSKGDEEDNSQSLRQLKLQHLEALTRVRNERDLVEEQEKLEELKEQIQRRKHEKQRELEHEEWLQSQKRELVARRLQRAIARESGAASVPGDTREQLVRYNPESGFVVFWDFVTGLPDAAESLEATYAIFEGKVPRTPFKALRRQFKKLPATAELQMVFTSTTQHGTKSVGWTAIGLFRLNEPERETSFVSGFFQVPLQPPPVPDPTKVLVCAASLKQSNNLDGVRFFYRLVDGSLEKQAGQLTVDPDAYTGPNVVTALPPPSEVSASADRKENFLDETDSDTNADAPWILADKSAERRRRLVDASNLFQPGDAFDVYIDGARGLPDSVTVTKVTAAALNSDRTQYVEYREKAFSPTLTLVIRVDTVETNSKKAVIVGYALLPVFLDIESQEQPSRPSVPHFVLNEGGFQLPLVTDLPLANASSDLSAKLAASCPRVPCATLLLRLKRAGRSRDGLQVLSRKDVPASEWASKGLQDPAPAYATRAYDSSGCVPSAMEQKIYAARRRSRANKTVNQVLQQAMATGTDPREELTSKPPLFFDPRSGFVYQPEIGFRVAVDGLHNVKAKTSGAFFKVLYSTHPPASFYQKLRLTGEAHFTTTTDWTSAQSSPEFNDGFLTFRDVPAHHDAVVLLDVRCVVRNAKTGACASQPFGWSFLPVLSDAGTVASVSVLLPLFQGDVDLAVFKADFTDLRTLTDEVAADKKKLVVPIASGASVLVRLEDPQVPSVAFQPLTSPTASRLIPAKALAKYSYDAAKVALAKKKTPLSRLVPAGATERQLEKELNEAFAQELGIRHYTF